MESETKPSSSTMGSLSRASFFWRLSSRRSSLASISSWTSEAAVVKPTDSPLWQAASPRPRATWVLPGKTPNPAPEAAQDGLRRGLDAPG